MNAKLEYKNTSNTAIFFAVVCIIFAIGIFYNTKQNYKTPLVDSDSSAKTSDILFKNNEYMFSYPKELGSVESYAATPEYAYDSVQYVGENQLASGKGDTELFDGYTFLVSKHMLEGAAVLSEEVRRNRQQSIENCDQSVTTVTQISEKIIDDHIFLQYAVENCRNSNHIYSHHIKNNALYTIVQSYVGSESDLEAYRQATEDIVSSFRFVGE